MAQIHVVIAGDTLWDLAQKYYGRARLHPVLQAANGIADPTQLSIGLELTIPDLGSGRTHEVVAGDELGKLAKLYYGSADKWPVIATANGISDPSDLRVGSLLWIPDKSQPSPAAGRTPLDGAAREVLKATLVPIEIGRNEFGARANRAPGGALLKAAAIRQLQLEEGDTDAIRLLGPQAGRPAEGDVSPATLNVLVGFERSTLPALNPDIEATADLPLDELATFADQLVQRRQARLRLMQASERQAPAALGRSFLSLNAAIIAARTLRNGSIAQPIGLLNLERLEMVPIGIQRGELVSTIPLAPGEETAVTHKEWSVTSREFTTIVTDFFEDVSETGVTDNTDISQSTSSQTQHSNQFNITATVQGGIPIVSGSTTTGFTAQDGGSASATESRKHARSLTQKASSRSRQEHKVTISTKTETGSSETSTRTIKNPSADPIRIDYFSMMREWRVRLYRYGLRLTYDIVVPEPSAAMRQVYADLDFFRAQQKPFDFPATYSDLDPNVKVNTQGDPDPLGQPKYQWLADKYDAVVPPYPADPEPITMGKVGGTNSSWSYMDIEFDIPPDAEITEIQVTTNIGRHDDGGPIVFELLGSKLGRMIDVPNLALHDEKAIGYDDRPFMVGQTGHQVVTAFFHRVSMPFVRLRILSRRRPQAITQWKNDVWASLLSAAQSKYYVEQQEIAGRIATLEERLLNVDTLTLRREESDEVMKSVLRWI